jgi:DNA-binding MurR/RpiR family transcriptional regulator
MVWIKDEVFSRMDQLTPAEKKVARSLLADYPSAGLASAAALADSAGTSTPTVLRFAARLGWASYPEFQKHLRDEITLQTSSPASRAAQTDFERAEGGHFERAVSERIILAESLLTSVPPSEFDEAVHLLSNSPKHVVISGGYFSQQIARLLTYQLDQIIPHVDFAENPLSHDISKYLRLRKGSVAIVFDLRRYELRAKQICGLVKKQGAALIVITDQGQSPSAELADIVLPVPVDGIPFDSDVAPLMLAECLVEAVFRQIGDRALTRMALFEDAIQIHRVFRVTTD